MAFFGRAADLAEADGDLDTRIAAVLGLARGQQYNLTPGLLPVRLHAAYDATTEPAPRARLAAALARCWAYAGEPLRARPFALEALDLADGQDDPLLLADALDAALTSHWGPDDLARRRDWAVRLDDAAAHLREPDARLQAQLWGLTVAWEVLDLPRMHRCMRAIELLGEESARARFFAATRRAALELLRHNVEVGPMLLAQAEAAAAEAVIPDADGVLHGMRGYLAWIRRRRRECGRQAVYFESYAVEQRAGRRPGRGCRHLDRRRPPRQGAGDGRGLHTRDSGRAAPRRRLAAHPAVPARGRGDCGRSRRGRGSRGPAGAVRRPVGRQRRRGDVARRHRRHPGPRVRPARRRRGGGPAPGGGAGDVRPDRRDLVA